ncbi:MAG: tetratricopeptide repeat protein [Candidatus Woesearchaeota archaeon]
MDILNKKLKVKHFYLILIIMIVIILVYAISNKNQNQGLTNFNKNHPNKILTDSIHSKLFNKSIPSKDNVSIEFRKKLNELEGKYKANPTNLAIATELADNYLAAHKNQEAIKIYESFRDKLSIDLLFNLTSAYYNLGDFEKADEVSRYILKKNRNEYRAIFNLGSINATKGNKEAAKKYWEEVINNYPNTEEALKAKEFINKLK